MSWPYILGILGIAVILYLIGSLRVLRQYERGVVSLLGKFEGVRGPGLTLIFVPVQQMVRVSLRTVTMQIPSQKIITKDNVSIDIAAVAYYHISDPEKAVIVIENVYDAIKRSARLLCAMSSDDSASISFLRTPRASTSRSRTSSTGTRSRGARR